MDNQGQLVPWLFHGRPLQSCEIPPFPTLRFVDLGSIATLPGASIATAKEKAKPSPSMLKPPPGAVILADTCRRHCPGWAAGFSFGNRLIMSSTRPGCGKGIQPDLLPCRASLAVGCNLSSRQPVC